MGRNGLGQKLALSAAICGLSMVTARSAVGEWQVPGTADHVAAFRLFYPDGVRDLRAVLVLVPGTDGDGRALADDADWQKLATQKQAAVVGCFFKGKAGGSYIQTAGWSGKVLEEAIVALGESSGHREMGCVPLAFWGHSAGGEFGYNFACWKPERTLCFVANKGAYYSAEASAAARCVPGLWVLGAQDTDVRRQNIVEHFEEGRSRGALWGLLREPSTGHGEGRSRQIGLVFFEEVLEMRLGNSGAMKPASVSAGWFGNLETGQFDKNSAVEPGAPEKAWFPGERTARLWQGIEGEKATP